jgi:hypothetical protein
VLDAIEGGESPQAIAKRWRSSKAFKRFAAARNRALLYEE